MRRGRCPHRPVQARSILCPEFAARCGHRALRKVLNWAQRRSLLRRAGCPQPAAGTSVLLLATSKHAWRRGLGQERLGAGAEEEQSGQQDTGDLQLHRQVPPFFHDLSAGSRVRRVLLLFRRRREIEVPSFSGNSQRICFLLLRSKPWQSVRGWLVKGDGLPRLFQSLAMTNRNSPKNRRIGASRYGGSGRYPYN